ncbi:MAG: glycosyltransferase [Chloroflexi bacterium]|nr:glycosyltransferase [Chloroflexota bacterium]
MKVLVVYKDVFPVLGGIETHILLLSKGLRRRGIEAEILVTNTGPRTVVEEIEGVQVTKTARQMNLASSPVSLPLLFHLRKSRADLVHLHFPYPFGEMAYLLMGQARRMVLTYHSDIVRQKKLLQVYTPFLWRILDRSDRIIATSPNYVRTSPYLSRYADKTTVIPSCIELDRFKEPHLDRSEDVRKRFPGPLLLFVGRLRYYKGVQYLLQAMPDVQGRLLVIGTGPMEAELKTLVHNLALEDKALFLGEVSDDDLPAYYQACDLCVLPSSHRSEALGLTQLEAMAAGKPVVCTELGTGTSYVNLHGETGLVVPPCDSRSLAEAINALLKDPDLRRRMGESGRERVRLEFSVEMMVDRIAALYRDLLENDGAPRSGVR